MRRVKLGELASKLEQIEQLASKTIAEHPHLSEQRQRLIMAIARHLRTHVLDQMEAGERAPRHDPPGASANHH